MTAPRFVAVVDIGKTNAKLALHDLDTRADLFVSTAPNLVATDGLYPHADVEVLWAFVLDALSRCAKAHPIEAISVTTHGACAALVDDEGLVLPVLDYESPLPDAASAAYDAVRPPFRETFSPRLPGGLNVGAQLFWLERAFPDAFRTARHVLFYPQYWTWRLTGVAATEVTSIACHTDLWRPREGGFSDLAARQGWRRLFPPLRSAFEVLGPLSPDIAAEVGLAGRIVPVHCGIHDSNASLLPHLLTRPSPFTILSTGTWIVALAVGGALDGLDPRRDTLANVDALGRAVPSARFMGGREFDRLTGGTTVAPADDDIRAVLAGNVMALPGFVPGTGPFGAVSGGWTVDPDTLPAGRRTAAASLYCAFVTAEMLNLVGAGGPTIVEGPFARNALFIEALRDVSGRDVIASDNTTGTTSGTALLAREPVEAAKDRTATTGSAPEPALDILDYAKRWRTAVIARTTVS